MHMNEAQRSLRDQFRRYMQNELDALTPQLESGALLPYPVMRKMTNDLGLALEADKLSNLSVLAGPAPERKSLDPESMALLRFAQTQLMVEMCRINPGFALSYGASL